MVNVGGFFGLFLGRSMLGITCLDDKSFIVIIVYQYVHMVS